MGLSLRRPENMPIVALVLVGVKVVFLSLEVFSITGNRWRATLTYFLSHGELALPVENSLQRNGAHPVGQQEHQVLGPANTTFGAESPPWKVRQPSNTSPNNAWGWTRRARSRADRKLFGIPHSVR